MEKVCAFDRVKKCSVLMEKNCEGCSFKKSEEELIEGRRAAKERIANLPYDTQKWIRSKYYKEKGIR